MSSLYFKVGWHLILALSSYHCMYSVNFVNKLNTLLNKTSNLVVILRRIMLWCCRHGRRPPSEDNHNWGVMVCMLALSAVDRGFEPWSGQTKGYEIGICCFSAKHAALRGKSKHSLARNQTDVFEWGDMAICGLLFQWASTIKIQLSMLV